MTTLTATVIYGGEAHGSILKLQAPISLWGGVDAVTGTIIDPRHPDCGACVSGRILALPGTVGSSSSSAIMLELLRNGTAPAAVILVDVDAILVLGVIVASELEYPTIPVLEVSKGTFEALPHQGGAQVSESGEIVLTNHHR